MGSTVVGPTLFVVGGRDPSGVALRSFESSQVAPDGTLGAWTAGPQMMRTGRYGHALVELNGLLYAIGGFSSSGAPLGSVEIYNPSGSGSWSLGPSLPATLGGMGAAVLGGRIYVFGGWDGGTTNNIFVFDAGQWSGVSPPLPNPLAYAMTASVADTAYVAGGETVSCNPVSSALKIWSNGFAPHSISSVNPMPSASANGVAGAVQGLPYVVGGCVSCLPATSSVLFFDPLANAWGSETSMPAPRCMTGGVSLNGVVYVVGGQDGPGALTTVESLSPAQFDLTRTVSGGGMIVSNPDQPRYVRGQVVQLTAVPDANQSFVGWSGDATGTVNPLSVRMMSDLSIGANFQPVNAVGESMGGVWSLSPTQPNPMSVVTRFEYTVAQLGHVRLSVLDVSGREVALLRDETMEPGSHEERWDVRAQGSQLSPGLYFLRYEVPGRSFVRRVVLIP